MDRIKHNGRDLSLAAKLTTVAQIVIQGLFPVAAAFIPAHSQAQSISRTSAPMSEMRCAQLQSDYINRAYAKKAHTIVAGESLNDVAAHSHISLKTLRELNRWKTTEDSDFYRLRAGEWLWTPDWQNESIPDAFLKLCDTTHSATIVKKSVHSSVLEHNVASFAQQAGNLAQSRNKSAAAESLAIGRANSAANHQVEQFLNRFGHARVAMNIDKEFHLDGSSADWLLPITDEKDQLGFGQLGFHSRDHYRTLNMGYGYRQWYTDFMLGINGFIDQEVTNDHTRAGFGAEYWRDYTHLSANSYIGLTGWKESKRHTDYDEKPANGFDIRSEFYAPALPELGAKFMYEQYFGKSVALFGFDERQRNPLAFTAGLNYTPIPLLTTGLDYTIGKSGATNTSISLQFNYNFGDSWEDQISPDSVRALRTLSGSRYDFVDRNYNMVMQYKKQDLIKLTLPSVVSGEVLTHQNLMVNVKSKYNVNDVQWNAPQLFSAGGSIVKRADSTYDITLPTTAGSYPVSAIAHDVKGNSSNAASMQIVASAAQKPDFTATTLNVNKKTIQNDGADKATYTLQIASNKAVDFSQYKVHWTNSGVGALTQTDSSVTRSGTATVDVSSLQIGNVSLNASVTDTAGVVIVKKNNAEVNVISKTSPVEISTLNVAPLSVEAGTTPLKYTLTAKGFDASTKIDKYKVKWTITGKTGILPQPAESNLDSSGVTAIEVSSTSAGIVDITAQIVDAAGNNVGSPLSNKNGSFTEKSSAMISTIDHTPNTTLYADGVTAVKVTAHLTKSSSIADPWSTFKVQWHHTGSGKTSATETPVDSNGQAAIDLTSPINPETDKFTATLVDGNGKTWGVAKEHDIKFDSVPVVIESLNEEKQEANADNNDTITYTLTVKPSAKGSVKPDWTSYSINWASTPGTIESSSNTLDANGQAKAIVKSQTAGQESITATVSSASGTTVSQKNDNAKFIDVPVIKTVTINGVNNSDVWNDDTLSLSVVADPQIKDLKITWDKTNCADCNLTDNLVTNAAGKADATWSLSNQDQPTQQRTVKACIDTGNNTQVCSKDINVNWVKPAYISGYTNGNGQSFNTADIANHILFNGPALKHAFFTLQTAGADTSQHITFSASNGLTVTNGDTVHITSKDSSSKVTMTIKDDNISTVKNIDYRVDTSNWYEFTKTMLFAEGFYQPCNNGADGVPVGSQSEFAEVFNAWGQLKSNLADSTAIYPDIVSDIAAGSSSAIDAWYEPSGDPKQKTANAYIFSGGVYGHSAGETVALGTNRSLAALLCH